eukprot:759294-Hanusia_phi.AAC.2
MQRRRGGGQLGLSIGRVVVDVALCELELAGEVVPQERDELEGQALEGSAVQAAEGRERRQAREQLARYDRQIVSSQVQRLQRDHARVELGAAMSIPSSTRTSKESRQLSPIPPPVARTHAS